MKGEPTAHTTKHTDPYSRGAVGHDAFTSGVSRKVMLWQACTSVFCPWRCCHVWLDFLLFGAQQEYFCWINVLNIFTVGQLPLIITGFFSVRTFFETYSELQSQSVCMFEGAHWYCHSLADQSSCWVRMEKNTPINIYKGCVWDIFYI